MSYRFSSKSLVIKIYRTSITKAHEQGYASDYLVEHSTLEFIALEFIEIGINFNLQCGDLRFHFHFFFNGIITVHEMKIEYLDFQSKIYKYIIYSNKPYPRGTAKIYHALEITVSNV